MAKNSIARYLIDVILRNRFKNVAEIGVYNGNTARKVLDHFQKINYLLHSYIMIDPWCEYAGQGAGSLEMVTQEKWESLYKECVKIKERHTMVKVLRFPSDLAARTIIDKSLDLVFIDGVHDYKNCKQDIEIWSEKIRDGGVLCGHDYSKRFAGVKDAVNEMIPNAIINKATIWSTKMTRR